MVVPSPTNLFEGDKAMRVQKNLIRELNEWMDNILYGLMHTPGGNLIILVGGAITLALALYNW